MKVSSGNINSSSWKTVYLAGVLLLLLLFSTPVLSQNTKGDRPASSREGRFKTQKKDRKGPGVQSKRIRQGRSAANSGGTQYTPRKNARGGERSGRPLRPVWSNRQPSEKQKAWKGDITGRKIRHKNESSTSSANVHRQPSRTTRKVVPDREGRRNVVSGRSVRVRSVSGSVTKVYPQRGKFVNNPSRIPRDNERAVSNRTQLARIKTLETRKPPPGRKVRIVPRTASSPYIRHKSINVYANFKRPRQKGEKRATTKDLAGRKIRTKNFETPSVGVIKAPRLKTSGFGGRDRPYRGPSGSYRSASGRNSGAWSGDISNRRIRSRSGKQDSGGGMFSRSRSATRTGRVGSPIAVRAPGIGAQGIGNYRGDRRGFRGFRNQGEQYSGAGKTGRRAQGGGSVSGKRWNNNGVPLPVRTGRVNTSGFPGKMRLFQNRPGFGDQGEGYSGAIKSGRPVKGGGSVSGKVWNNDGRPLEGRLRSQRGYNFTGNIKSKRPEKGGGSISGKLWNNGERPIESRFRSQRGYDFAGNIKAKRPAKGGASISGKLWNNNETPIDGKTFPADARKVSGYPGKLKLFENQPGFNDQGEEFTGYIKLSRLKKNYVQNKHAHEESIKKKKPQKEVFVVEGMAVKVKTRPYVENKNAAEESLRKLKPTKTDEAVGGLQVRVKQYNYKQNPSSAEGALKVREPGRAFARATDYQGNIKMQKFKMFERNKGLHPDATFVRTNKNNVDGERDAVTNLKLWWARLFKKQDNQPVHLKEKLKKPRYDNGEQGLWYD